MLTNIKQAIVQVATQISKIVSHIGKKRSPQWKKVRLAHLKNNYWCKYCGNKTQLEVHHIKPFYLFPELELNPKNLITLCEKKIYNCHFRIGHLGKWKNYNPEVKKQCKY
jgi:5-methylcytosine-specific restriction endonuclease McrA